jgi:YD repeat-containing protein
MSVRRLLSAGLSIAVIVAQLMMPLGQALASLPEPAASLPRTGSRPPPQQHAPQLAGVRESITIPVIDSESDSHFASEMRAPTSSMDSQPSRDEPSSSATSPLLAAQEALTIPLGTGNNNYGQTQRDTDNPQNHPGHHFAGSVNLVNGNFFLTVGDFFIPGRGLSLQLARSYSSLAAANGEAGAFGYGWTHSYETHVISATAGITLTVVEGDGSLHNYANPHPCPDTPAYTCYESPPGLYRQLRDMKGAGYLLLHRNGTMQQFGAEGQLVEIVDQNGNQVNLYYNPSAPCTAPGPEGTLCQVVGPSGQRSLQFTYVDIPGIGTFISEVAEVLPGGSLGRTIAYGYEPVPGELSSVVYPDGGIASYSYDGQHQMIGYDDPRQPAGVRQAELIVYDVDNRTTGVTYDFAVDSFFDITYALTPTMGMVQGAITAVEIEDGAGHISRVEFDAHANVVYEGDWYPEPEIWIGKWWWWHVDRWWLLESKVDANDHTTSYAYDDWGNTTVVTNALGATQHFLWEEPYYESLAAGSSSYGNVLSATNSRGVTTLYGYDYDDPAGPVVTEVQAAGTPDESVSLYENDNWGQLVHQIDLESGQVTEYAYDGFGNTTVITDARGNVTHNGFDMVGRPITTTDQVGNATTYVYDAADRLRSVTDPQGGTTRYTYSGDGRDNLVQLVNANGVTTTYAYNAVDLLITETNSLSQTTSYSYDALNRLTERTDADGRVTRYEYEAKSRMTKAEYYEAGAGVPYQTHEYRYDPAGNLVWMANENVRLSYEYDALDQRTSINMWTPIWALTRTLQLQRDPLAGNLTRITGPGAYQIDYEYDPLNRLSTVWDKSGTEVYSTTYSYDTAGRVGLVAYPGDISGDYAYDATNHLTDLTYSLSGGDVVSYTYDYDSRGNIIHELDEGEAYTNTYDAVGRVISTTSESQGAFSIEYDAVGNRLAVRGATGDTEFTYSAHNQLLEAASLLEAGGATFSYNEMGARTEAQMSGGALSGSRAAAFGPAGIGSETQATASTVHYDYDNDMRLTDVDPGLAFLYDPMGNLIGVIDEDGSYRYFLRDGEDVYVELDESGDVLARYTIGGQGVLSMWRDGGRYLFLYDGRGLVRRLVDMATGDVVTWYSNDPTDTGRGLHIYSPIRYRGALYFPEVGLVLYGGGVFWDLRFGVFLVKAWPWLYWPFGPFHPWRPIFRFWPWPWPWPRPWGWPWPRPWPFLWPWPGAWVRPWVIWPFWPWFLRPWWPWWYWRWWWGWVWWGRWWCWHPWPWFCKWWWWPWWHPWWWWGYWWFPWWWWAPCWWWPFHWWWWIWWWWPGWWSGWFYWWCWWWRWPWHWWWWPWGVVWRGPPRLGPPEVGDAPDPLYASYLRNRGAVHGIWWYEWLGGGKDGEWDSDQVDVDLYDDGVDVDLVAGTLTFTPTVAYPWSARYGAGGPLHVHGWFDWNEDGDWLDANEFVVNWSGYPGDGTWPAGQSSIGVTQSFTIPTGVFDGGSRFDLWTRFRLDYAANWESPRDYTRFGEVEDYTFICVDATIDGLESDSPVPLGESMAFTATVSGSEPISYTWDFGGAGVATHADTATPTFTYDGPDTYTVTLTVENLCGMDQSTLGVCILAGDVNGDGSVDIADIMEVASRWRTSCGDPDPDGDPSTPNYNSLYDLDGDCDIDVIDIMLVVAHWGEAC